MKINLNTDLDKLKDLKSGDTVYLTGVIYTARDAAHMRIEQYLNENKELPVDFSNHFIYYAGPTPTKPGMAVGSIGPTTSSRMDKFSYMMKKLNVLGTIGKGPRDENCFRTYNNDHILYLITTGGIGALLSKCVKKCDIVAFDDLGTESIKRLEVENFPVIVAYDYYENDIFRR